MAAVARQGDTVLSTDGSGYRCSSPMNTLVGECNLSEVFCERSLVVVSGNRVTEHPRYGCDPLNNDKSILTDSSATVFVGGNGIGRLGDTYENTNMITSGSTTVFSS